MSGVITRQVSLGCIRRLVEYDPENKSLNSVPQLVPPSSSCLNFLSWPFSTEDYNLQAKINPFLPTLGFVRVLSHQQKAKQNLPCTILSAKTSA